jgi:hypothetical protein
VPRKLENVCITVYPEGHQAEFYAGRDVEVDDNGILILFDQEGEEDMWFPSAWKIEFAH